MTDQAKQNTDLITEMIARSPAAQTREQALASIKARRARLLARPPVESRHDDEPDLTRPEPMPIIDDPDAFAAGFWTRFNSKEPPSTPRPPPRGSKPRIVVDNTKPQPPRKR